MLWHVTDGPGDADAKQFQIEQLFDRVASITLPPVVLATKLDVDSGNGHSEGLNSEPARSELESDADSSK